MGILSFIRSIYDLDTLDTRFTNPSSTPYKTVIDARKDADIKSSKQRAALWASAGQPAKWKTPEFVFYVVFLTIMIPYMFYIAYDASKRTFPHVLDVLSRLFTICTDDAR